MIEYDLSMICDLNFDEQNLDQKSQKTIGSIRFSESWSPIIL